MVGCEDLVLHGYLKGGPYVGEVLRSVGMGRGFGGLLSRLGTSVRCHVARDKKRVRRKKQFFKLYLARTCLSLLNVMLSFLGTVVGIMRM